MAQLLGQRDEIVATPKTAHLRRNAEKMLVRRRSTAFRLPLQIGRANRL
jgi:hypothetical protein